MTPVERQILMNQKAIMFALRDEEEELYPDNSDLLNKHIEVTKYLLNPTDSKEPSCDMDEALKESFCSNCGHLEEDHPVLFRSSEFKGTKFPQPDEVGGMTCEKFAKDKRGEKK